MLALDMGIVVYRLVIEEVLVLQKVDRTKHNRSSQSCQPGMVQDWVTSGVDSWAYANGYPFQVTGISDNYNGGACSSLTPDDDGNYVLDTIQGDPNVYQQSSLRWITNWPMFCS